MGLPPLRPVKGCEEKLADAVRLLVEALRPEGELSGCGDMPVICSEARTRMVSRCAVFVP